MSYRFMRVIVFFDLPTETNEDKRNYRKFRKTLITNGFIMLQESVYTKMLITPSGEKTILSIIRNNRPPKGLVQLLTITEKQFAKMHFLTGEYTTDVLDTDERLVIL